MTVQIIQGGAISFIVRLTNKITGDPVDLTTATAITCCFQTGTTELTLSLGSGIANPSPILGKITVSLTAAQTTTLSTVDSATLELTITLGSSDPFKNQIPQAYSVVQSVC